MAGIVELLGFAGGSIDVDFAVFSAEENREFPNPPIPLKPDEKTPSDFVFSLDDSGALSEEDSLPDANFFCGLDRAGSSDLCAEKGFGAVADIGGYEELALEP
jgi:hypothetical protein